MRGLRGSCTVGQSGGATKSKVRFARTVDRHACVGRRPGRHRLLRVTELAKPVERSHPSTLEAASHLARL